MLLRYVLPICLSLAAASTAFAADRVLWGESGPWKIYKDPAHGNGCLVETALSDGSHLRIGFEKKGEGKGYIASFNPAWKDLREGEGYEVTVKFGDQSFGGKGRGVRLSGQPGIMLPSNNIDLLVALAKESKVSFALVGGTGGGLDVALKGSEEALKQALVCQAE